MKSRVYRSKVSPGYLALIAACLTVMYGLLWQTWDVGGAAANAFMASTAALVSLVLLGSFNTRYWIDLARTRATLGMAPIRRIRV